MLFQEEMLCRNYGCTLPSCSLVQCGLAILLTVAQYNSPREISILIATTKSNLLTLLPRTGHKGLFLKPIQAIPKGLSVLDWMYLRRRVLNSMPTQSMAVQETYLETRVPMNLLTLMGKLGSQQKRK